MIYKRGLLRSVLTTLREELRKFDVDLVRSLTEQDDNLGAMLDRGLTFGDNFDAVFVSFTTHATPGNETTVAHDLGRVPTGYIPVTKDKAADVYSTTASDKNNLYLKSDVASAAIKLLVF